MSYPSLSFLLFSSILKKHFVHKATKPSFISYQKRLLFTKLDLEIHIIYIVEELQP